MSLQAEDLLGNATPADLAPLLFRNMDSASNKVELEPEPLEPALDPEQIAQEAREAGLREGFARSEQQMQMRVDQERQGIARAVEEFMREKQRYFAGLEKEVVRLSLAIAERVLHREAAMDPTLLAGAARVALEQVNDGSDAVLRVSPDEVSVWTRTLAAEGRAVTVSGDASLQRGECLLETATGTVEFGVRAQLQEIERGFFELLGRNPAVAA